MPLPTISAASNPNPQDQPMRAPLADAPSVNMLREAVGSPFAAVAGAKPVTSEVRRVLRIAELDDALLARLRDDAVAHSQGYSLMQWDRAAPAELPARQADRSSR